MEIALISVLPFVFLPQYMAVDYGVLVAVASDEEADVSPDVSVLADDVASVPVLVVSVEDADVSALDDAVLSEDVALVVSDEEVLVVSDDEALSVGGVLVWT